MLGRILERLRISGTAVGNSRIVNNSIRTPVNNDELGGNSVSVADGTKKCWEPSVCVSKCRFLKDANSALYSKYNSHKGVLARIEFPDVPLQYCTCQCYSIVSYTCAQNGIVLCMMIFLSRMPDPQFKYDYFNRAISGFCLCVFKLVCLCICKWYSVNFSLACSRISADDALNAKNCLKYSIWFLLFILLIAIDLVIFFL